MSDFDKGKYLVRAFQIICKTVPRDMPGQAKMQDEIANALIETWNEAVDKCSTYFAEMEGIDYDCREQFTIK